MSQKAKHVWSTIGFCAIGIGIVLAAWTLAVEFTELGKLMPGPLEVAEMFARYTVEPVGQHTVFVHALVSLRRVAIGYAISSVVGVACGLAMGYSKMANAIISPIFNIFRPIPGVAWIPMAILWFGIGETAKIFIIFMGGFAHVTVNSMAGARRVNPELVGAAELLGASKGQVFRKIVLPSSVPYIFAGLQVSLSGSWMAVLAAEMVSSLDGSGWIIVTGMNSGNTTQILVGMISIAIIGLILASVMRRLERKVCSWNERGK